MLLFLKPHPALFLIIFNLPSISLISVLGSSLPLKERLLIYSHTFFCLSRFSMRLSSLRLLEVNFSARTKSSKERLSSSLCCSNNPLLLPKQLRLDLLNFLLNCFPSRFEMFSNRE